MQQKKHETLCWKCEWASANDKKCPWATSFEPVPGWDAKPTKVKADKQSQHEYVDSFDVYECPLFELLGELKRRNAEKEKTAEQRIFCHCTQEHVEKIKRLRGEGKTYQQIADEIGFAVRTVCRVLKKAEGSEK